jgi:hypothetical protein
MNKYTRLFGVLIALAMASMAWAGESVSIRLKDGSTWRGQVSDQIVIKFVT